MGDAACAEHPRQQLRHRRQRQRCRQGRSCGRWRGCRADGRSRRASMRGRLMPCTRVRGAGDMRRRRALLAHQAGAGVDAGFGHGARTVFALPARGHVRHRGRCDASACARKSPIRRRRARSCSPHRGRASSRPASSKASTAARPNCASSARAPASPPRQARPATAPAPPRLPPARAGAGHARTSSGGRPRRCRRPAGPRVRNAPPRAAPSTPPRSVEPASHPQANETITWWYCPASTPTGERNVAEDKIPPAGLHPHLVKKLLDQSRIGRRRVPREFQESPEKALRALGYTDPWACLQVRRARSWRRRSRSRRSGSSWKTAWSASTGMSCPLEAQEGYSAELRSNRSTRRR